MSTLLAPAVGTEKLYTMLSDGQWYPLVRIQRLHLRNFQHDEQALNNALEEATQNGILYRGEHNENISYRMVPEFLTTWRQDRDLPARATTGNMSAPRIFGGILEDEVWGTAPLRDIDVVHFHATESALQEVREQVGLYGMTVYNYEGLMRIFSLSGDIPYDIMQRLSKENPELGIRGIRIDRNVRRREMCDLPDDFAGEFLEFYGKFAHLILRKSMTSVEKYITNRDDVQQQIYIWVIDAIQRYDNQTNIPFAAYFASSLNRWIHDLPRKPYGRAISDAQLHINRARTAFMIEHNRTPNIEELAETLNEPIEKVRKKVESVENVNKLSSPESLTNAEGDTIDLPSLEDSTTRIEQETQQHLLSLSLTTSALQHPRGPQIISWLKIYDRTWVAPTPKKEKLSDIEKDIMNNMRTLMEDAL